MTRYLLYFLTGVATATVILFFRGYASVPKNIYSDVALLAGMVLFGLASWLTFFRIKIGSLLALISSLALAPWLIRVGVRVWEADAPLAVQVTHAVVSVLAAFSIIISARYTFSRGSWKSGTSGPAFVLKVLLAAVPLAVLTSWLLVMSKL